MKEVIGLRESDVERVFCREVKRLGGWPLKLTCAGTAGMPDRLVIFPGGRCKFVELKRLRGEPRALQQLRADQLRALGCDVACLDSPEAVARWMEEVIPR